MTEERDNGEGEERVRQVGVRHESAEDILSAKRREGIKTGESGSFVRDYGKSSEQLGVERAARKAAAELINPTGFRPFLHRLCRLPGEIRRRIG